MSEDITIKLEGWNEAVRGLRKVSAELPKELKGRLKEAADLVRVAAIDIAGQQGLAAPGRSGRGTGALVRGLRTFANGNVAGVRDNVKRGGYAYPRQYEFGQGGARAYLAPAGQKVVHQVEEKIDAIFDDLRSGEFL